LITYVFVSETFKGTKQEIKMGKYYYFKAQPQLKINSPFVKYKSRVKNHIAS
jgi:hypothetical protein